MAFPFKMKTRVKGKKRRPMKKNPRALKILPKDYKSKDVKKPKGASNKENLSRSRIANATNRGLLQYAHDTAGGF